MKFERIIDLSQPFAEGGFNNPAFEDGRIETCMTHEEVGWHAETIITATHTGTHIDAPLHKLKGGKSLDEFPLERFFGEAVAVDLFHKRADEEILLEDLTSYESFLDPGVNVLLCTGWAEKKTAATKEEYLYHSPWLGRAAAEYLVEKKVNAVGIDHFSIGGANPDNVEIPHEILLSAEVLIWEGLLLPRVLLERKPWTVFAFPLMMKGTSGAPARIVAVG